jgi:ABC-type nitrate/sulfonate/bicarbonate transport system permease component
MRQEARLQGGSLARPAPARSVAARRDLDDGDTDRPERRARAWGWLLSAAIVVLLILAWQALIWIQGLESYILPTPRQVVEAFGQVDTRSLILDNISATLTEALIGFAICLVVGAALAVAMFASRVMRDALYPLLIASQAVPTIAIGAVLLIAFGYGAGPKVVVVVLYSFFAVTVNIYDSLQSLDPELPALLRSLGASPWRVLRTARIPAALPGFFTGAKLAITYCISGAIYGEWVGATEGLGYALQTARNQFATATVFAIVVVMAVLGLLGFAAVAACERLLIPWNRVGRDR